MNYHDPAYASSKLGETQYRVYNIESALRMFKLDNGRFPTNQEGLDLLLNSPKRRSYVDGRNPFIDSWGNKFVYLYPARKGGKPFELYSFGGNEKDDDGEGDDITNWRDINEEYYGGISKKSKQMIKWFSLFSLLSLTLGIAKIGRPKEFGLAARFSKMSVFAFILFATILIRMEDSYSGYANIFISYTFGGLWLIGSTISLATASIVLIRDGISSRILGYIGLCLGPWLITGLVIVLGRA